MLFVISISRSSMVVHILLLAFKLKSADSCAN